MSFGLIVFNTTRWQPSLDEWERLTMRIGADERARIARFKRADRSSSASASTMLVGRDNCDAKQSLVGRLLMQSVVAHCLRCAESELTFARLANGKPQLVGHRSTSTSRVAFNVAHAGELVCLLFVVEQATSTSLPSLASKQATRDVGVDLTLMELPPQRYESLDAQQRDFLAAFERDVFTPLEWRTICGGSDMPPHFDQRCVDLFFVHWALKEAFVKHNGRGLTFGLTRIEFRLRHSAAPSSAPSDAHAVSMALAVAACCQEENHSDDVDVDDDDDDDDDDVDDSERLPTHAVVLIDGVRDASVHFRLHYGALDATSGCWQTLVNVASAPRVRTRRAAPLYCVATAAAVRRRARLVALTTSGAFTMATS